MEKELKTGTTTVGVVCKDGVVLAADKRATAGFMVANKKTEKIIKINDDVALTTAGTVSDVQLLVKLLKAELKLKEIRTGRKLQVKEAANLLAGMVYSNIRKFSVIPGVSHFILGGKDSSGVYIYDLYPDGSLAEVDDFISSGSGSVYALGVLETLYKPSMSLDDGIKLSIKAVNAAMQRDVASGEGIDVMTITKDEIKKVFSQRVDYNIKV
ncbi:proteasome subunit beta [Candidatus Woesearchaeota archaeon]|nr:proteasome subunit beta [Candidatus Woesearchaeota archaeon]